MATIFESPDGGETIYAREAGQPLRRLVKADRSKLDRILEDKMWGQIRRMGETNPTMRAELDRVIMLFNLLKENDR